MPLVARHRLRYVHASCKRRSAAGSTLPDSPADTYDAFISYSHALDGELAPALQRGLQRFAKPWYRPRALRIFRDEASLSANPGLWSSIERALSSSSYFILLASPQAASSVWVGSEASHWRSTKPIANLLIALTDGELVWDANAGDFDWERTNALPDTLRRAFAEEPRFIDLRWAHADSHLSLSHPRFRDAVADLAAPLHGVPKDVLAGEEVRQHRSTVRLARLAGTTLACFALAALAFGVFAVAQRNEARRQRDLAVARSLVQDAATNLERRMDLAALLSLEAYRINPSAETRSGLIKAVERTQHVDGFLHSGQSLERVAVSEDRARLAAAGSRDVVVWDLMARERTGTTIPVKRARAIALSQDGHVLVAGGPRWLSLWRVDPQPRLERRIQFAGATALAFIDDKRIGVVGPTSVAIYDASRGTRLRRWSVPAGIAAAAFSPDGKAVTVSGVRALTRLDVSGAQPPLRLPTPRAARDIAWSPDGANVAALDIQGDDVTVWTPRTGTRSTRHTTEPLSALAFAPDGGSLALAGKNGQVEIWPVSAPVPSLRLSGPAGAIRDIAFPAGSLLATAGEQGVVVLWDPSASSIHRAPFGAEPISDIDVSDGAQVVAVGKLLTAGTNVWSIEGDELTRRSLPTGAVGSVAIDAAGARVAVAGRGVSLYEPDESRRVLQPARADGLRVPLAFSSDDLVAWGTPGRVRLWDANEGRALPPIRTREAATDLAFGGLGKLLAVATAGGVAVWNVLEREPVHQTVNGRPVNAVAISRSGRLVASASSGQVSVWDAETGRSRFRFPIDLNVTAKLSFSADENTLAAGTSAGELLLIDTGTGQLLAPRLPTPGGPVADVDFGAEGVALVTGTQGGLVTIWDDVLWTDVDAMEARLCAVAGRSLTEDEWREFLPGRPYRTTCP